MPAKPPKRVSDKVKITIYPHVRTKARLEAQALIKSQTVSALVDEAVELLYRQLPAEDRKLVDQIVQRTEAEL